MPFLQLPPAEVVMMDDGGVVLTAQAHPSWSWLRQLVAPILICLCLAMDRMFIRMQQSPCPETS